MLTWLTNFLTNHFQSVVINNINSSKRPVSSRVPQGSVLGPLLFAIYVNDMSSTVSSPLFLFVDDTKLYHTISDIQLLQNDIKKSL